MTDRVRIVAGRSRVAAVAWIALSGLLACGRAEEPPAPAPPPPAAAPAAAAPAFGVRPLPANPTQVASDYSRIVLDDRGSVRTLSFVRDSGEVVVETRMDLAAPHRLVLSYTQHMFVHYLLDPDPERALLVGLGGGAMVRFLEHHDPDLAIDALDIDPAIVRIADEYFGVRSRGSARVHVADAYAWIGGDTARYDVIYLDAFLKPSSDTDSTGAPLRLKTEAFLRSLAAELRPGGSAVFNINTHQTAADDVAAIQAVFPRSYLFQVPGTGNLIVLGSTQEALLDRGALREAGRRLDARSDAGFSFAALAGDLVGAR